MSRSDLPEIPTTQLQVPESSSHGSGEHVLRLAEHLNSRRPPSYPVPKKEVSEAARKSSAAIKAAGDMLVAAVDQLSEGMLAVLEELGTVANDVRSTTEQLRRIARAQQFLMLVQLPVLVLVVLLIWRIERTSSQADVTVRRLDALTRQLSELRKESEATKKVVDDTKKAADEKTTVELVPDPDRPGAAVVRIVPPKVKTEPALPPLKPKPSVPPVDIPVKLNEARPVKGEVTK